MANDNKLQFEFPAKVKKWTFVLMGLGVLSSIGGWVVDHSDHHQYWWAVLLVCAFMFFAIALGAMFFYALQYAAEVAWSSQLKRLFEAMFSYLKIGFPIIVIILLCGQLHIHHLYHWMDHSVMMPYKIEATGELTEDETLAGIVANPDYDHIIAGKQPYLSAWFFWLRVVIYGVVFLAFAYFFRKWSLQEDQQGSVELHKKIYRRGALFLVFFAVFSSTIAWDWLMSIDTHWFSTMYGWYIFSGMWVSCMIFVTLLTVWLKSKGYLPNVNSSHIHDLGKWVFAISMLWSYLWFCQYMLIWYSNIPEEVTYFQTRYEHYMVPMFGVFFVNFAVPFYTLISRDTKRNKYFLWIVGSIIFLGHFADFWMAVIPGTTHGHSCFTVWFELGMFLGFLGLFLNVVLTTLSKARLVPANHPFLKESEQHHI